MLILDLQLSLKIYKSKPYAAQTAIFSLMKAGLDKLHTYLAYRHSY